MVSTTIMQIWCVTLLEYKKFSAVVVAYHLAKFWNSLQDHLILFQNIAENLVIWFGGKDFVIGLGEVGI